MFIPLRPETLEAQGKPLATYALIAVWFVVHLLRAIGVPTLDWDAWGLVPGDLAPEALPTHIFLHASWAHLIGASLLLLLVGPALESRWGRGFYVAFVLLAAVAANGIYALVAPGLMRPLVGAAGGLTALLAACVLVYWRPGLHFTPLVKINGLPASLHLPAYVLPAAWLVCEIIASTGDHPVGMTRGTAYWGQLAGVAIGVASAWALRHWHLETGLPGACLDNERPASSTLVKALAAISAGRHELAFELLEQSARAHPDDADTITNLWETACACNKVGRAAPLVLLFVQQQITDGDEALALGLWCELVNKAPKLQAHPRALVELASGLARDGRKREAAWTLRCAAQQRTLLPGAAMRIASLAKGLHPSTGIAAARRALETPGLDQSKRSQIEQLIRELEEERRSAGEINLDATRDRAIDIELDESFAAAAAARESHARGGCQRHERLRAQRRRIPGRR
ncbi:MAG: rhomboid family intramembrane serine protease [Myxococcales bacterium]|nr:rhomboid family intramembrane serine protease [Myxococcales bacterium]